VTNKKDLLKDEKVLSEKTSRRDWATGRGVLPEIENSEKKRG